jgi:REP element-mobilizing transposase RayT
MRNRLERRCGHHHLHFITCSCYRRLPFLRTARARDAFLKMLDEVRTRYGFALVGCVVRPEQVRCNARVVHVDNKADALGMKTVGAAVERFEPLNVGRSWEN